MPRSRSRQSRVPGPILALLGTIPVLLLGFWFLRAPSQTPGSTTTPSAVTCPHMHGMGWTGDGSQLVVAAHDGTRIFRAGEQRWVLPDAPQHDLMGYTPTDQGFYSSGHPDLTTGLVNPLGLVKSRDGGKTLLPLGFVGERDFHLLAAGYFSHVLYVVNPEPTAQLETGLAMSVDEGVTWTMRRAEGVAAPPLQLAVHPREPQTVAIATEAGLFLSTDAGETFRRIGDASPVTAVAWSPASGQLVFGGARLSRYDPQTQAITAIAQPTSALLSAIAPHPTDPHGLAIATHDRDIYRTTDDGQTWQPLARGGVSTAGP